MFFSTFNAPPNRFGFQVFRVLFSVVELSNGLNNEVKTLWSREKPSTTTVNIDKNPWPSQQHFAEVERKRKEKRSLCIALTL